MNAPNRNGWLLVHHYRQLRICPNPSLARRSGRGHDARTSLTFE